MTDKPKLTKRQETGLRELLSWDRMGRPYQWMPSTMRELARMGYAEQRTKFEFRLTPAGRDRARELQP